MMKYLCGRVGTGGFRSWVVSGWCPVERLEFGASTRMAGSITGKELVEESLRKCQRGKCTLYLFLQTITVPPFILFHLFSVQKILEQNICFVVKIFLKHKYILD